MRTCIAATRKVSHVFIYKYVYKVSGAHAPLGPTVDTPLLLHGLKYDMPGAFISAFIKAIKEPIASLMVRYLHKELIQYIHSLYL